MKNEFRNCKIKRTRMHNTWKCPTSYCFYIFIEGEKFQVLSLSLSLLLEWDGKKKLQRIGVDSQWKLHLTLIPINVDTRCLKVERAARPKQPFNRVTECDWLCPVALTSNPSLHSVQPMRCTRENGFTYIYIREGVWKPGSHTSTSLYKLCQLFSIFIRI